MAENADDKAKSSKTAKQEKAAKKVEQAQVESGNNTNGPVQPIEAVRNKPEVDNEEAETVKATNKPNLQQGDEDNAAPLITVDEEKESRKSSRKSNTPVQDAFREMGVDIDHPDFYNLGVEAERAQERERQAQLGGY